MWSFNSRDAVEELVAWTADEQAEAERLWTEHSSAVGQQVMTPTFAQDRRSVVLEPATPPREDVSSSAWSLHLRCLPSSKRTA